MGVGPKVDELRKKAGIASKRQLAKLAGMDPARINDLIHNRYKDPKPKTLEKVARAIGCSWLDFYLPLEGEEQKNEQRKKSETASAAEAYNPPSNSAQPGDPPHAGSEPVVAFTAALRSAQLPTDIEELARTVYTHVQRLNESRLFFEGLGAALLAAGNASTRAARSRGPAVGAETDPPPAGSTLRHPSRRQAR